TTRFPRVVYAPERAQRFSPSGREVPISASLNGWNSSRSGTSASARSTRRCEDMSWGLTAVGRASGRAAAPHRVHAAGGVEGEVRGGPVHPQPVEARPAGKRRPPVPLPPRHPHGGAQEYVHQGEGDGDGLVELEAVGTELRHHPRGEEQAGRE